MNIHESRQLFGQATQLGTLVGQATQLGTLVVSFMFRLEEYGSLPG